MNAERRKQIEILRGKFEDLIQDISEFKDIEQEAYDNLPESFQYGEKGERGQTAIDALDSAESSAQEVCDYLTEAIEA